MYCADLNHIMCKLNHMQFILTAEKLPLIRILNDDKMHKINNHKDERRLCCVKYSFGILNLKKCLEIYH